MVVQTLGGQHLRQLALLSRALFDFRPLVLEPDLDLVLIQPQLDGEVAPSLLCQVAVVLKLFLQPPKLIRREGCSRPFFGRGSSAACTWLSWCGFL